MTGAEVEGVEDDGSALLDLDHQTGVAALRAFDQGQVHVEKEAQGEQAQPGQAHARIGGADHIAGVQADLAQDERGLGLVVAAHLDTFQHVAGFEARIGRKLRQRRRLARIRRLPPHWRVSAGGKRWTADHKHDESKG